MSDAPGGEAGSSRRLSDLRHGPRAGSGHPPGRERRAAVDGPAFQSWPDIGTAGAGSRDGRALLQFVCNSTEGLGVDSILAGDTGGSLVWVAVL